MTFLCFFEVLHLVFRDEEQSFFYCSSCHTVVDPFFKNFFLDIPVIEAIIILLFASSLGKEPKLLKRVQPQIWPGYMKQSVG